MRTSLHPCPSCECEREGPVRINTSAPGQPLVHAVMEADRYPRPPRRDAAPVSDADTVYDAVDAEARADRLDVLDELRADEAPHPSEYRDLEGPRL